MAPFQTEVLFIPHAKTVMFREATNIHGVRIIQAYCCETLETQSKRGAGFEKENRGAIFAKLD